MNIKFNRKKKKKKAHDLYLLSNVDNLNYQYEN